MAFFSYSFPIICSYGIFDHRTSSFLFVTASVFSLMISISSRTLTGASSEALIFKGFSSAMAAYLDGVLVYNRFLFFQFLKHHVWQHWSKISQSNECTVKSYIIQILQTLIGSLDISVTWQTAADWMTCLPTFKTPSTHLSNITIVSSFCARMSHFLTCTAAWTSLSKPPPRRPQAKIRANLATISLHSNWHRFLPLMAPDIWSKLLRLFS